MAEPGFYLQFKEVREPDKRPDYVRRGLFMLAYSRSGLIDCATRFPTRDEAEAYAREHKIEHEVVLAVVTVEDLVKAEAAHG